MLIFFWPMWAGLLVFTVIFLLASMLIQDGQADPPVLIVQLNVGTIPQLIESINWIAVVVV